MPRKKLGFTVVILVAAFTLACRTGSPARVSPTATPEGGYTISQNGCILQIAVTDSNATALSVAWGDGTLDIVPFMQADQSRSWEHVYATDGEYIVNIMISGTDFSEIRSVTITDCTQSPATASPITQNCPSTIAVQDQMVLYSGMDNPAYLYLYTEPSMSATLSNGLEYGPYSYDIEPGTALFVREGPVCAEGLTWWKVQHYFDASIVGWTPEASSEGTVFLFLCEGQIGCMSVIGEAGPPDGGYNP